MEEFERELISLINRHSLENMCDMPDFVLAKYLVMCLETLTETVRKNEQWNDENVRKNERMRRENQTIG